MAWVSYTHLLSVGLAVASVLCSASGLGCWLVVQTDTCSAVTPMSAAESSPTCPPQTILPLNPVFLASPIILGLSLVTKQWISSKPIISGDFYDVIQEFCPQSISLPSISNGKGKFTPPSY